MTPAAARLFRTTEEPALRAILAASQFFETSALYTMAGEMVAADVDAGALVYSEMAQLPAPSAVIEFVMGSGRVMMLCRQEGEKIQYRAFLYMPDAVIFAFECGFLMGSTENLPARWNGEMLDYWAKAADFAKDDFGSRQATGLNGLLEKMLCMINQPGLVEKHSRPTDKRVLREASKYPHTRNAQRTWARCDIRPGQHGEASSAGDGAERKLHYVRKYFKPSIGKWIDGYWRGNADIGVHLKWYKA